jgi:uncharacterized protein YndB with AHSA1/START domain
MSPETTSERDGRQVEVEGRPGVRFVRELAHPPERIWRAITEPAEAAQWLPTEIQGDLNQQGAELRFDMRFEEESDEETATGSVTESERPRVLAYTWGDTAMRFEIEPAGTGSRLTFTHVLPLEDSAKVAAGWQLCLDSLEQLLGGEPVGEFEKDRWTRLHDGYAEEFGVDPEVGWRARDEHNKKRR